MTKPRNVVEYGSGYTTLFVLKALADNIKDVDEERRSLYEKTNAIKLIDRLDDMKNGHIDKSLGSMVVEWYESGGKACQVDPRFYLSPYRPHLYSFEKLADGHEYTRQMRLAIEAIGNGELFTHLCGQVFRKDALPADAFPIDWCWNDDDRYREFFLEFWDQMNPAGGIMIFHNVSGELDLYEAVQWMKKQRQDYGDLEILILEEPHKLNQNSCAILRRTKGYQPRFALTRPMEIFQHLREFIKTSITRPHSPP